MFPFLLKKKSLFSLQGPVMVYLYKCPFCVFGEMDSTKGCGSDDFISTAFLSVSSSISRLTEAMSLKMSYRHFHTEFSEKTNAEPADPWQGNGEI